jgi:hypothetical protein
MKPEAKILALGYAKTAGTESNVVATADLQGIEQIFIAVRNNVGTANDAGETGAIKVEVREATDTNGGATSYTTIVGTTQLAAFPLASAANVATDKTLSLSRRKMGSGARFLQVTCDNSATGTASETFLSVIGLMPTAAQAADYSL